MLQLKNITKVYSAGGTEVRALGGVDLSFRESEFVCVLGPSGCGKTTLLNIIGGLDHYTDGDLIINGRSTKGYRDADWDAYRNFSIGFVFQNYNLIPHQSVAANVELALTLSGVSKAERTARAKAVLERVGLGDQLRKKPNQLSGGQMQRVAIARALVNDPDILLADEPTGALDSETSVQVMDVLKEISKDKLVVMVTHNPELADKYATRIIRLLDGRVLKDIDNTGLQPGRLSGDYEAPSEAEPKAPVPVSGRRPALNPASPDSQILSMRANGPESSFRTTMSFLTALTLSFTNLLTKKFRTALTAFAGSIGIIGIALILSLSNGLQTYIDETERNTLSSYPIMIEADAMDLGGLLQSFTGEGLFEEHPLDRVYTNTFMEKMMNTVMGGVKHNDLRALKAYIDANEEEMRGISTAVAYSYNVPLNLYRAVPGGGLEQVNPGRILERFSASGSTGAGSAGASSGAATNMMDASAFGGRQNIEMWRPLIPNREFIAEQYEVVAGSIPQGGSEAALIVTDRNEIPDIMLYALGLKTEADIDEMLSRIMKRGETLDEAAASYSYEEILALEYSVIPRHSVYAKSGEGWQDRSGDALYMSALAERSDKVKLVGILRPKPGAAAVASDVYIGYTEELMRNVITSASESEIVKSQKADPDTDVFTGLPFAAPEPVIFKTMDEVIAYINAIPDEAERQRTADSIEQAQALGIPDEQLVAMVNDMAAAAPATDATYEGNLEKLGATDIDNPSAISIYASSFENKDAVADFIARYNAAATVELSSAEFTDNTRAASNGGAVRHSNDAARSAAERGKGGDVTYTDYIGLLMSSVTVVINAISIVLIAFVSISLVVSSIMIGIITYISVLERTREIGVLRAIGASKRDIARVFNAETLIIGFSAGALGIAVTALLCIPANAIVYS
ncbi:MAG: ABC transporter ATP-binding protein/permease, partial [Oscillospiraceae bacterium]|nr:ABC transporter ATP-binding protein/permease [Oscillospiraceae bacterium]